MNRKLTLGLILTITVSLAAVMAFPRLRTTIAALRQSEPSVAAQKTTKTQSAARQKSRSQENFDIRAGLQRSLSAPPETPQTTKNKNGISNKNLNAHRLLIEHPHTQMQWSSLTGAPSRIINTRESLTEATQTDAAMVAQNFLTENRALLHLDQPEINDLRVSQRDRTAHNGVTHITYNQQIDGIEIFQGTMSVHLDRNNAVIAANGELMPQARAHINRTRPVISMNEALQRAATAADIELSATPTPTVLSQQQQKFQLAKVAEVARPIEMKLVYFPLAPDTIRLAWSSELWLQDSPDVYLIIIDAEQGSLLFRHNFTNYENPHGLVFTDESPRPDAPHISNDPPYVQPQDLPFRPAPFNGVTIFEANNPHFDWWAGASPTTLVSNNVDAHLDRSPADNAPDTPQLTVLNSNFSFTADFSKSPTDADYQKAAQTNLFYWVNRYHDILYSYGFTESSGNFQTNNFNLGGSGGDAIQADAQDGSGTNNANFSTPSDGRAGRVQMYLWNSGTPQQLDGDFDQGVIIHELTHGLTNRLVGNATGLSGQQSGGMGEGWSDYFALTLLRKEDDPLDGGYGVGQYVRNNYPVGIRRYLYSTNKNINPLTFANISLDTAVHRIGEIWCLTLWEMRAALIQRYGFAEGQRQSIQLVVDGLKLTPNAPGLIEARDAILLADRVNNNGANQCLMWQAFAKRGLGVNAFSLGANDGAPQESFEVPAACNNTGTLTLDKQGYLPNETMQIVLGDGNAGNAISATISSAVTGDQETIALAANPLLPGNFSGQCKIVAGKANNSDGVLQVAADMNEQISVRYNDQANADGVSQPIAASAIVAREKIILQDNAESGNQGWFTSGNWSLVTTKAASLTHSWTDSPAGSYSNNSNTSLTSPRLNCADLSEVTLQFAQSYALESNFDFGLVEYSIDDGATWNRVTVITGVSSAFNQATIQLRALSNQPRARIRFRLLTDNIGIADGWYIDDIRVTGRSANPAIARLGDQSVPVITSVTPAFGSLSGGTRVTIYGNNFSETADTTITFDGITATNFAVISNNTITATTPAHNAGAVTVRVKNRYGEATLGKAFTYYQSGAAQPTPILTKVFPASGATRGGQAITLSGANFTPESTVKIGVSPATATFVNANTLRVNSPVAGSEGAVDVAVSNGAQSVSLPAAFTYLAPTPPTIQNVSPSDGPTYFSGALVPILWTSNDNHAIVKHRISLFRDASFVSEIATDVSGEAQIYYWRISATQALANNYRIRITATDDEGSETETYSNTFTIARNWQTVSSMPAGLMRMTFVGVENNIIAIGGRTTASSSTPVDAVNLYNTATNSWSALASLPVPLSSTDAVLLNNKIYVPGGITETSVLATHYVYDVATNAWTTAENTPFAASAYACAADTANNVYYVTGGLNNATSPVTNVRSFNVQTNNWAELPPLKTARYAHESALIDGKLYVAGGLGTVGGLTTGEVFDFASGQWTNIAALSRQRAFAASAVYRDAQGNPFWVLAGGQDSTNSVSLSSVEIYDVRNNRWIQLDASFNMNLARTQTNGTFVGEYFYVLGGGTGSISQPSATNFNERIKLPLDLNSLNTPPAIAAPSQLLAIAGQELKFAVTASDLNATSVLSIAGTNLPGGASFALENTSPNEARGTLRWTPANEDTGKSFAFTFKATDGTLNDIKNVIVNVVQAAPMAVVNAAHYRAGALPIGSMASAFGDNLALRVEAASALPLPLELAGTKVFVNGTLAPLLYVSPTQINFIVPDTLETGAATIIISNPNGKYSLAKTQISKESASLFTLNASGTGDAAALATTDGINYLPAPFDITVNGNSNYLILFGTGFRNASAANPMDENGVAESVRVTIDGIEARVDYVGAQGFYAGLDQLNIVLPATLQPGTRRVEVAVSLNGIEANRVTIPLK